LKAHVTVKHSNKIQDTTHSPNFLKITKLSNEILNLALSKTVPLTPSKGPIKSLVEYENPFMDGPGLEICIRDQWPTGRCMRRGWYG